MVGSLALKGAPASLQTEHHQQSCDLWFFQLRLKRCIPDGGTSQLGEVNDLGSVSYRKMLRELRTCNLAMGSSDRDGGTFSF